MDEASLSMPFSALVSLTRSLPACMWFPFLFLAARYTFLPILLEPMRLKLAACQCHAL